MKYEYDIFEFWAVGMTFGQRVWRVVFLLACIVVAAMDLFVWRP